MYQMLEWQKILVTACVSFSVGMLAETIKPTLSEWIKRRQIRKTLYSHLALCFDTMKHAQQAGKQAEVGWQDSVRQRLGELTAGPYTWASSTEAAVFYTMPESQGFDVVFGNIADLNRETVETLERALRGIDYTLEKLNYNLSGGRLSRLSFNRAVKKQNRHLRNYVKKLDKAGLIAP